MPNELATLRKQIKSIDVDIIKRIAKRFSLVKEVGKFKKKHALPINDLTQEKSLIDYYKKILIQYNLPEQAVLKLFKQVISLSKNIQKNVRK